MSRKEHLQLGDHQLSVQKNCTTQSLLITTKSDDFFLFFYIHTFSNTILPLRRLANVVLDVVIRIR